MTVHVAIGNSDDKLSQVEWSEFVQEVDSLLEVLPGGAVKHRYGFWMSLPSARWQNACWAVDTVVEQEVVDELKHALAALATRYRQDEIAWTEGRTAFLQALPEDEAERVLQSDGERILQGLRRL